MIDPEEPDPPAPETDDPDPPSEATDEDLQAVGRAAFGVRYDGDD